MKKKNIYVNQSQELLSLFEEAGNNEKIMCVPIDTNTLTVTVFSSFNSLLAADTRRREYYQFVKIGMISHRIIIYWAG